MSPTNAETATLAEYLKVDLQRIAKSANEDLRAIGQAGMMYSVRRNAEARVIDEARALAVRRVESTMRQLRQMNQGTRAHDPRPNALRPTASRNGHADMDKTQVLSAVRNLPTPVDLDKTQVIPAVRDTPPPSVDVREDTAEPVGEDQRLQRMLTFVARQEPRLNWAVGECPDGTTLLATDLAHGWIPPGIAIPDGVRLLEPKRRSGRAAELLGATTRAVTYSPGDSTQWAVDSETKSSEQPLELPTVEDLDWELGVATHWRDGLPRLVNTLAKAAAGGADLVEQEVDLLRVHLDTVRYQVLAQYPDVELAQLLNCMLLAATERSVSGDRISANYHFSWFDKLNAAPVGEGGVSTS